ncbi:hypothetical protein [Halolamina sp. C58]|uniref:hypothetical protein n=1 Tax=Halolamina sp. C58 TaxID=3421640 RepID=UPI003EBC0F92
MEPLTVAVVAVEGALLVALWVGYRRGNTAAVVNTLGAACLTLVPPALAWALGTGAAGFRTLTFWVAVAGFLHALGMLGRYESVGWWDHLTHTLSAALVAALLYAALLVVAPGNAVVGTLLGTFALGVLWEIGELIARDVAERYDIEPVLVHYGRRDTALDLVFDVVGAGLVLTLDLRSFLPVAEAVVG